MSLLKQKGKKTVILYPGEIRSKNDGDIHFISAPYLIRLYRVLPTDDVITFDRKNPMHSIEAMNRYYPYAIHLHPLSSGEYFDIHAEDDLIPIRKL